MDKVNWGIIGCGDVTEIKSGPAFNKVKNSSLVAVMRRNAAKAEDYARRHHVLKWYDDASSLINDPDVNAIYIATPPSSHEEYAIAAFNAGKPVYVEKPMTINSASAIRMTNAAKEKDQKLVVAHYRRAQPFFNKVKQLVDEGAIGEIRLVRSEIYKKPSTPEYLAAEHTGWRLNPTIAGGGLFHDIGPHQLDLMDFYFGEIDKADGYSANQNKLYNVDDIVVGNILFKSGVIFSGVWCFSVDEKQEKDSCEIIGSKGKINFSFFEHRPILLTVNGKTEEIVFDPLPHVQQPLIEKIVDYFTGQGANPCSGETGITIMKLIDCFTKK